MIKNIVEMNNEYFEKQRNQFRNRLAKAYASIDAAEDLDSNNIDYVVLDIFEEIVRYGGVVFTGTRDTEDFVLENNVVKALLDA